jgi:outer membrane protein TolC
MWEQLVIQLKLPHSFLNVPADEIPIKLDSPQTLANQSCSNLTFEDVKKRSSSLLQAKNLIEAAEKKYQSLLPKLRPDLRLQANLTANGIDAQASETIKEMSKFSNPGLNVGLSLNFPVQNNQIKSQLILAQIEISQAKTNLSLIENNLNVRWRILCNNLKQKLTNIERFKKINETNSQRVSIDNRKFRLGRIKAFQWVQTEDDEAASYLKLQQSEIEVRLIAWEIEKISGKLAKQIEGIVKVHHE